MKYGENDGCEHSILLFALCGAALSGTKIVAEIVFAIRYNGSVFAWC